MMEELIVSVFMHMLFLAGFAYFFFAVGVGFALQYGSTSEEKAPERPTYVEVEIKSHNGVFFVYQNNNFLFQAVNKDEVEAELIKRFPNMQILADTESREVLYGKSL